MKHLVPALIFFSYIITNISCSTPVIMNERHHATTFSNINSDFIVTDTNNYGCKTIDLSVLNYILRKGIFITEKELHDSYSTTGCTIKGSLNMSDKNVNFVYDYGGMLFFNDGSILACGKDCCREDYPNCSWDKEDLKGTE